MCGFGLVQPLPGIVAWHLDTAITLPVGVEAYGAYALGAWLTPGTPDLARAFARGSALGALALGMLGQVGYHLLAAAGASKAPWPVTVCVSCVPVVTLGFGAALAHMLRAAPGPAVSAVPESAATPEAEPVPESGSEAAAAAEDDMAPEQDPGQAAGSVPDQPRRTARRRTGHGLRAGAGRISDDDLRRQIRPLLEADPDLSAAAAARTLRRGRDRTGRLLAELRSGLPAGHAPAGPEPATTRR